MSPRFAAVLLALALAVGVVVAAPAPPSTPNPKEQEAAAALKKVGFELEVAAGDPRLRVTGAIWVRRHEGPAPWAEPPDLARLRDLPHLTRLRIYSIGADVTVDEEAARHLARLGGVESLQAFRVQFQPGALAAATAGMPRLKAVQLDRCPLTGGDLDALGKLPRLRALSLADGDVTDDDLGPLGKPGRSRSWPPKSWAGVRR